MRSLQNQRASLSMSKTTLWTVLAKKFPIKNVKEIFFNLVLLASGIILFCGLGYTIYEQIREEIRVVKWVQSYNP